ncbi:MAG: hypothetical protein LBS74_03790 [Oscillospiraceae bacterium]|jgi:hypothetical protein|nr:hypothetical protein [Oscillospiraceae bacterium]
MQDKPFIGIGSNPHGKDLPLGFGMQLAQEAEAMNTYTSLAQPKRDRIVDYIQSCTSGDDSKRRISTVIEGLKNGQTEF